MKLVAVTTSADRVAAATIPFKMLGLGVVPLPCIAVEPVADDLLDLVRESATVADLIVISSRRTIDILWPDGDLPACDFAAVGPVTARAVTERGGEVIRVGRAGAAELASSLQAVAAGRTVIWPHARGADPRPLEVISQAAAAFAGPVIYGSVPQPPGADEVDVVTFASPSAVAGWQLSRKLAPETIAVIGDTTRRAVEEAGCSPAVVAGESTFQSLAESVAEYLGAAA